jgi:lipopolysaccharide heptosyltransferase II
MSRARWLHASRVLCVRLDALGDVLMTAPAIRAVKTSVPRRQVVLLTSPAGARAAALLPEIDEVLVYDAPWMKAAPSDGDPRCTERVVELLRGADLDAAVIFTVYTQNPLPAALLCHLAGIPLRLAHCRENPYQLLTDWVRDPEPASLVRHEVRRQLDLVASVGCRGADDRLAVHVPADVRQRALARLAAIGLDRGQAWVAVHPGASAPSRRYPPEHFAEVGTRLVADGQQVLFVGSAAERALIGEIRVAMRPPPDDPAGTGSFSLGGDLDTAELAAVLAVAPILVANNSGPAHLAAAVGTPVVALYALTNPQHTPWRVARRVLTHDVPCRNCYRSVCPEQHHRCLRGIAPATVVAAVHELLAERAPVMPMPMSVSALGHACLEDRPGAPE